MNFAPALRLFAAALARPRKLLSECGLGLVGSGRFLILLLPPAES